MMPQPVDGFSCASLLAQHTMLYLSCRRKPVVRLGSQLFDACLDHPPRIAGLGLKNITEAALDSVAEVTQDTASAAAQMELATESQVGQERYVDDALHCTVDIASGSLVCQCLTSLVPVQPSAV